MGAGRVKAASGRSSQIRLQCAATRPQVPSSFLCPIHLEVMRDPVTLHTGMTYDRVSIETWLAAGKNTCPVTNQPLLHRDLIPNHALKRAILAWSTNPPLSELLELLHSINTESSLYRLAAVIPHLEDQQKKSLFGSDPTLAEQLSSLISSENSLNAAAVLHFLCEADPTHVGAHPEAIKALVTTLLKEESVYVLKCLYSLCRCNKKNRIVAIECQAVRVLMELIERGGNVGYCCGVLESLANCAEGREAIRGHPFGVARIVESLLGVSDVATEHAVGALWGVLALAADRRTVMQTAMQAGVFSMLLMVMSSECSQKAKSQAREMLKMLNAVYAGSSSSTHNTRPDCGVVIKRRRDHQAYDQSP